MAVLKSRKKLNNKINWARKTSTNNNESNTQIQYFRFNQKKDSLTKTFFKDTLVFSSLK